MRLLLSLRVHLKLYIFIEIWLSVPGQFSISVFIKPGTLGNYTFLYDVYFMYGVVKSVVKRFAKLHFVYTFFIENFKIIIKKLNTLINGK